MKSGAMKNLHVPLPPESYDRLKQESVRAKRPATSLARQAIEQWLSEQERLAVREAISEYARSVAGTSEDLDPALERAATEHLARRRKEPRTR